MSSGVVTCFTAIITIMIIYVIVIMIIIAVITIFITITTIVIRLEPASQQWTPSLDSLSTHRVEQVFIIFLHNHQLQSVLWLLSTEFDELANTIGFY